MSPEEIFDSEVARTYLAATGEALVGNNHTSTVIADSFKQKLSARQTVSRVIGHLTADPQLRAAYAEDAKQLGLVSQ